MTQPASRVAAWAHGWRQYAWLSALALLYFAPGIASLPPTDRDEARFVQATRQMLESDDYVRIRFQDKPRHKKPAGAYWLQAAAVHAVAEPSTRAMWPYRLPSLLAAWATLLIGFRLARGLVGAETALVAATILGTTAVLVAEAHLAKADAALLLTVVVAQGILGQAYVGARRSDPAPSTATAMTLWLALGVGILVKGPVLPGVFAATVLALAVADRGARWLWRLRPIMGAALCAAVTAPWFIAVQQATDGAFIAQAVGEDILPKLLGVHESHGGPPGFYAVTSFASFWPWSLWTVPALLHAWTNRRRPDVRFFLAWLLPSFAVLELAPTKLPHYVLPLFPALAALVALLLRDGVAAVLARRPRLVGLGFAAWLVVGAALSAVVIAGPIYFDGRPSFTALLAAGLAIVVIATAWREGLNAMAQRWLALPLVAALGFPLFLGFVFPSIDNLWVSVRLGRAIASVRPPGSSTANLLVVDYNEPSLVFLQGTATQLVAADTAAARWIEDCAAVAVVRERSDPAFHAAMAVRGADAVEPATEVTGFNYSNGKWLRFRVYAREGCSA